MREIHDHKTNIANEHLQILAVDAPGSGGASHVYDVHLLADPSPGTPKITSEKWTQRVSFQNGPIQEAGVNGVTQEALLAIVIDRLRSFQAGKFSCRENAVALTKCEEALMWLQKRTRDRAAKGIEGTNIVCNYPTSHEQIFSYLERGYTVEMSTINQHSQVVGWSKVKIVNIDFPPSRYRVLGS